MALTDTKLQRLQAKGRTYQPADGGGLYIEVHLSGKKVWRMQYRRGGHGSRKEKVALGEYPAHSSRRPACGASSAGRATDTVAAFANFGTPTLSAAPTARRATSAASSTRTSCPRSARSPWGRRHHPGHSRDHGRREGPRRQPAACFNSDWIEKALAHEQKGVRGASITRPSISPSAAKCFSGKRTWWTPRSRRGGRWSSGGSGERFRRRERPKDDLGQSGPLHPPKLLDEQVHIGVRRNAAISP